MCGLEKSSRVISEKEKKITANHEAGHAVVSLFTHSKEKIKEVSIIPHGTAVKEELKMEREKRGALINWEKWRIAEGNVTEKIKEQD